jgi:hypothetical protein
MSRLTILLFGEEDNMMTFTELELAYLDDEFTFYRYTDGQGKPLAGQHFAIRSGQVPAPLPKGEYAFVAAVKILNQPNSPMQIGTLTSTFINEQVLVRGKSPAATVASTHRELVHFLLEQLKVDSGYK